LMGNRVYDIVLCIERRKDLNDILGVENNE
jgi:hypothetical protein